MVLGRERPGHRADKLRQQRDRRSVGSPAARGDVPREVVATTYGAASVSGGVSVRSQLPVGLRQRRTHALAEPRVVHTVAETIECGDVERLVNPRVPEPLGEWQFEISAPIETDRVHARRDHILVDDVHRTVGIFS